MERSLVLIKPDGVQRGLIGAVISRIEHSGLKIVALKMLKPTKELVAKNYPDSDAWYSKVGNRTINTFREANMDLKAKFGTDEPIAIGKTIKGWIIKFMTSGNVVAMVVEGNKAVDNMRKLAGETIPVKATAGTIRGDLSIDDVVRGNALNRPILNVVHASDSLEDAKKEIENWFAEKEIYNYKIHSDETFYKQW